MDVLGVGKRYRASGWVVREVSLQVQRGELAVFEGANGSGKSTLLRMIAGIADITAGEVAGRPATVAYAPDHLPAEERMSARSFLTHMGRLRGLRRSEASQTAQGLIERFELVGDPGAALRTLSKGNVQKVCLAQAFIVPSELLVLDEPTSSLDESAVATLFALIEERRNAGAVCITSDHPDRLARHDHATVYEVADTRVVRRTSATNEASRLATLLRQPQGTEVAWHSLPGVRAVTPMGVRTVEVRVSADCSNQLIDVAIGSGWTLTEMRTT